MPYLRLLPSKKWQATYRDARNRRHSITRPTKAQARTEALEAEAAIRRGAWIDPELGRATFREWHDKWWAARVVEESTRRKNKSVLSVHVLPEWGSTPLDAIRHIDVQTWVARMVKAKVGAETIHTAHQIFAAVVEAAVREGLIRANVTRGVQLPTVPKQPDRYVADEEVAAIVAAIATPRDRVERVEQDARMVALVHKLGLRWGEVAGLHVHRVDLGRKELHVVEVATRHDGIKAYPKSKRSRRTLPLTDALVDLLAKQVVDRPARGLVFPGDREEPLSYSNWRRRVWVRALGAAAIGEPLPTFHDLRHTAASNLAADGMDGSSLRDFMGHESLTTTNRYLHAGTGSMERMRAVLGARDAPLTHDLVVIPGGKAG